jgi:DNA (cytosine-5)-methyltransferase 1
MIRVADSFSGIGGFSTGAVMAGCEVVWAGNHWQSAVDYHTLNHPDVAHDCQDLQQKNWHELPFRDIHLASPSCQGHTPARGKDMPRHDAARATAWAVVSALEVNRPEAGLVENVPAMLDWVLYPAWVMALQKLGYSVAPHIVDAADFGVPQNRVRVMIAITRSKNPIQLNLPKCDHVPISRVIDFDAGKWSLVDKPRRSAATLSRVARGRQRFGDRFLAPFYSSGSGLTGRSLDRPIGTLTTIDRWAIVKGEHMRCLSRFEARDAMSFPKNTTLPDNHKLAIHLLGNAVPPLTAQKVISALQESI